jgi:AraC family transcriptional regulator of adaptative response/methylated-DNA-[protein]-cysteine methyltransferase
MNSTGKTRAREKYQTDAAKWRAIIGKDRAADGHFVYSVRTTGVYCRPSCSARIALRKNVAFHASPEAAEAAGFRACKRCVPNGRAVAEVHAAAVAKACRTIEAAEETPMLDALAKDAAMSRYHFHRIFSQLTGITPKQYAVAHRSRRVGEELLKRATVTEAIYRAGFNSSSRFYEKTSATLGMTPANLRNGGVGLTIRFAIGESSLGSILVAASEKGVCAILMGDDPAALAKNLQERFPRAALIAGDATFEQTVARVVGLIESPRTALNLPLDLRGTVFQLRVWQALQHIPVGTTVTYREIAHEIGAPNAVRAVGRACGANPVAVIVPCHRVVRTGNQISGYRWGIERKRALLAREQPAR